MTAKHSFEPVRNGGSANHIAPVPPPPMTSTSSEPLPPSKEKEEEDFVRDLRASVRRNVQDLLTSPEFGLTQPHDLERAAVWYGALPGCAATLERMLFNSAKSMEEYEDSSTLPKRIKAIAKRVLKRSP